MHVGQKSLSLILAVAAAVVAVLLFWPSSEDVSAPDAVSAEVDGGVAAVAGSLGEVRAALEAAAGSGTGSERRAIDGGEADTSAQDASTEEGEVRHVTVLVIDGATQSPVPGAEVAFMTETLDWASMSNGEKERHNSFGSDRFAYHKTFGASRRTDETGRVRLPLKRILLLSCWDEGRFGSVYLHADQFDWGSEQRLVVQADARIRVRVVNEAGQPLVGVPLRIRPTWQGDSRGLFGRWGYTASDGVAVLGYLRSWCESWAGAEPAEGVAPDGAVVGLGIPGLDFDGQTHALQLDDAPDEILELVAPPTGQVVVSVFDSMGEPVGGYEDIRLGVPPQPGLDLTPKEERYRLGGEPLGDRVMGAARFPYVALGRRFRASFSGPGEVEPSLFEGPAVAEQVVRVDMAVAQAEVLLTALVVDEDQKPVQGQMRLRYQTQDGRGSFMMPTEADGRLRIDLEEDMVGQEFAYAYLQPVSWGGSVRGHSNQGLGAELPVGQPIRLGRNDYGRVVLKPLPVLVSGTARLDGEPAKCELNVERQPESAVGDYWLHENSHFVEWGEDGEFVVRGPLLPGVHRLTAWARGALPLDSVPFVVGQKILDIDLVSGGSLRAEVLLDDEADLEKLRCLLIPMSPTPERVKSLNWRGRKPLGRLTGVGQGERRAFVWQGVAPGSYRLELRCAGVAGPVVSLDGVTIESGTLCEDPRLVPIDLRGQLSALSVTLLDEQGQPLGSETGAIVWAGDGSGRVGQFVSAGKARVLGRLPVAFSVVVQGYAVAHLTGVTEDCEVRLQRLPMLEFELPALDLPPDCLLELYVNRPVSVPAEARVWLQDQSVSLHSWCGGMETYRMGSAKTVSFPAQVGDAVSLTATLHANGREAPVALASPAQVLCDPTRSEPFLVRIDPDALQAAAAQLGL
ncbi:MAG: hypothetical protein VYE77_05345 [Planctomycetota bacterium]|nr:hypothetical protein [Planctomycetota bacterium]